MKEPKLEPIKLQSPIKREGGDIKSVDLRKPVSGELRGVSLLDLAQLDVQTLQKVIPRVSSPSLTEAEVAKMDIADLTECGMRLAGFLQPNRDQFPPA